MYNFDAHRLSLLPGRRHRDRGVQGRRVRHRPVYSALIWARPADRAEVRRRPDRQARRSTYGTGQGMQAYRAQPAPADLPGHPRAPGARADATTARRTTATALRLKRASSVFNNSEFAAEGPPAPGELEAARAVPRRDPERGVRRRRTSPPRTDSDPNALRHNLLQARALLDDGRLEARRRRRAAQRQGRAIRLRATWRLEPGHRARACCRGAATSPSSASRSRARRSTSRSSAPPRRVRLRHRRPSSSPHSRCRRSADYASSCYGSKAADEQG